MCPRARRLEAWERLGRDLDLGKLKSIANVKGLTESIGYAEKLLAGKLRGRVIVDTLHLRMTQCHDLFWTRVI